MAKFKTLEEEINAQIKLIDKLEALVDEIAPVANLNPFIQEMANKAEWDLEMECWGLRYLEQENDPHYQLERAKECMINCVVDGDNEGAEYFNDKIKELTTQILKSA